MKLTPKQANTLCQAIINKLAAWPTLNAALQEGGFEQKAAGWVEIAITEWIAQDKEAKKEALLVLRQGYRTRMS